MRCITSSGSARRPADRPTRHWRSGRGSRPVRRSPARPRSPRRVLTNIGRFADAEIVLLAIPRGRDAEGTLVRQALELLYRVEGRESRGPRADPRIVGGCPRSGSTSSGGCICWMTRPFPSSTSGKRLQGGDPEDDRVWLGRANLAIWLGQLEEAGRWLDACFAKRPEDPAVCSARLDLARATQDLDAVRRVAGPSARRAGSSLPRSCGSAAGSPRGPAMNRSNGGSCWHSTAEEPGRYRGLGPAGRAGPVKAGRRDEVEAFRRKKAEMSALRERYAAITEGGTANPHAEELGRLAEALGRRIEARGWSLIHQRLAARRELVRHRPRRHRPAGSRASAQRRGLAGWKTCSEPAMRRRLPSARRTDERPWAGSGAVFADGRNPAGAPVLPRQWPHPQESAADRGRCAGASG